MAGLSAASDKYMECLPLDRDELTFHQQCQLLGNGMHLAAVGAVMAYIMAHCVRREDIQDYGG